MQNRKYFPFERNSYYFGKLLTTRDFEAEQRYFNDKRRFVNRLTGANGIVAGMGVVAADDSSVIIQAGCAFDASGREIVVPETKVVKLSTIEGYDDLTSTCAYLSIRYDEQPTDEVYNALGERGEPCFGKIQEGFRLTLTDESMVAQIIDPLSEFVESVTIFSDEDISVIQYTPRLALTDTDLVVEIEIIKRSLGTSDFSVGYLFETPGLKGVDGSNEHRVALSGLRLSRGQTARQRLVLRPEPHIWGGGEITAQISGIVVQKDSESFSIRDRKNVKIKPVEKDLTGHYMQTYYQRSMDRTLGDSLDEKLWIAKIELFRQKSSMLIDRVIPVPFSQFSYNAQQLMQLKRLESFYGKTGLIAAASEYVPDNSDKIRSRRAENPDSTKMTASGVFDISLGMGYSTKEPVFSEEIMHGLGKGPVYVEIGVEYISGNAQSGGETNEIILGDIRLFAYDGIKRDEERIYNVSTAVKVLPERGTFIAGVQPKEASGLISLRIRWFAMRLGEVGKQVRSDIDGERHIIVNPDTIVVQPKGTAHITPIFMGFPAEACRYSLVDAEGGSIDNNGLYTASAKEGVYEIRIEAISDPTVFTHAFAIVTQMKKEESSKASNTENK